MKKCALFLTLLLIALCFATCPTLLASTPNTWTTKTPMTYGASDTGSPAVLNGKIYVVRTSDHLVDRMVVYDVNADSWVDRAVKPEWGAFNALAACEGKIYAFNRHSEIRAYAPNDTNPDRVYDPITDSWAPITPMPSDRSGFAANVVDGKIYIISGCTLGYIADFLSSNWVYNPESDSWSSIAPIPTPVSGYASAVVNGKIYIIGGGYYFDYPIGKYSNLVQIYDPKTNQWSQGTPLPTNMSSLSAATFVGSDLRERVCIVGGQVSWSRFSGSKNANLTQIYDPQTKVWSNGASLSYAVNGVFLANVNNKLYAIGGLDEMGRWVNMNEEYTPPHYGLTNPKQMPPNILTPTASPSVPEFPAWIILTMIIFAVAAALALRKRNLLIY